MKRLIYIFIPVIIILLILILFFIFYKRIPSAAWKIEEIEDIFTKGVNAYIVFDDMDKILENLNKNGLIDTIKNKGIIEDLLLYLGISKKLRDEIIKRDFIRIFKKMGIGFYENGYLIVLEPEGIFINLIYNLIRFEKEFLGVPYTFLRENFGLFLIEKYIVISNNENLLKEIIEHLKKEKKRFKKFYKRDFPENILIYGAYLKEGVLFKAEKFIFYYKENEGFTFLIEEPSHLFGKILKNLEPDLRNLEFPPDHVFYISFKNFNLKEEIERFIKEKKEEKIEKFFEKYFYLLKDIGESFAISFNGLKYLGDYYVPLFLIKIEKRNEMERSFNSFISEISKEGGDKIEGKKEGIYYKFFIGKNNEDFIGYFNFRNDFYISSSLDILRDEISVLNKGKKKKDFPQEENLFLYFDGIKFLEFLKDYFANTIPDEFILENKIYPFLNLLNINEIYGTFKKEKNKIMINLK
ncbi:MAG: hypothetical protein ABIM49_03290 [candidate division WOR-3 bacterium]